MSLRVDAVFENGVFRPINAVNLPEGTRVRLNVFSAVPVDDDLSDIDDLLDHEYMQSCLLSQGTAVTLEEVREILASVPQAFSDLIAEERNDRNL